eukprot:CAMPEP_0117025206 /NCGR_PEP_ID=MMETSP0472-20121206/18642_1 /TAXON_ID=693140 ORGANISM="Tiarina fusus, Strain LIS" /NCGR_SAMPLE_ID=MMETSP0472 /ASSEMBLY_ACC=CAM_ASM_000603 /LENGTH=402 /DNA_ID=CAMNT_0004731855 /DNA_START=207 /DNA_END=1415 /DNA_ORIENTATION=+
MAPSASSALVNIAEDAELRLVRLLAESSQSVRANFVQDCEACIVHSDASQLMKTILNEQGAIAALVSLGDEAVSAISLLAALLDRIKNEDTSGLVKQLADSIQQASAGNASRCMSLLAALYNMRADPTEKVALLVKMIQLGSSQEPSLLAAQGSVLGKWVDGNTLPTMLDEWNVPSGGRRELYRAAAEGATSPDAKQRFTLLLVETYAEGEVDSDALASSQQAAIGAIRDPVSLFVNQRDILALPAIRGLQKKSASLLSLLTVFQEGKLEDYHSFIKANGGEKVLTQWGLSPEECIRHMRVLSLCSLAAEHEEIPYSVVTETLQTEASEVEKWVIAAVSSGLLSAKMDQVQEKVIVERCVVRKFDMDQWKALQSRLNVWKQNVSGILEAYKESLQQQQQQQE